MRSLMVVAGLIGVSVGVGIDLVVVAIVYHGCVIDMSYYIGICRNCHKNMLIAFRFPYP